MSALCCTRAPSATVTVLRAPVPSAATVMVFPEIVLTVPSTRGAAGACAAATQLDQTGANTAPHNAAASTDRCDIIRMPVNRSLTFNSQVYGRIRRGALRRHMAEQPT